MITLHVDYNTHEPVRRQLTRGQKLAIAFSNLLMVNALREVWAKLVRRFSIG